MTVGPIQMVVIGFEGDVLESNVLDEIEMAVAAGDIRLIDFLVIEKDELGQVWGTEVDVFAEDDEQGESFGALTFRLIDQDDDRVAKLVHPESWAIPVAHYVMGPGAINDLVHLIPQGSSAIVVLLEHAWAGKLHEATVQTGGLMLAQGMIDHNGLVLFQKELEAIQEAQAVEAEAILEAAEVVAFSEAVKQATAREAAQALVAAKMIEEAALEEAAEVVAAAMVIEDESE